MGDGGDLLGQGKDHVEIGRGQEFGAAILQPLGTGQGLALWAVAVAA